ncbi:sugar-binding domain-containing protein [Pelagicoccus sp. SDUM812003]|uniref:glycoside hydrolase family 2 protein n=1 Tax=Pelagicoccus sp. SDUM812003 TaxID=3041267 RepID=UPI00280CB874|nr:sugar-binding domain-containing protein [Pelagicoccus sp. SDUM812003]MDQ8201417.1 glycoside hydrolase family 2 TIM barrel-domain containing protein [Pelagicoccus sp. SDUM812003]
MEIDLSGNHWKMEKIRPGAGVKEEWHKLPSEYQGTYFNWNQASVPGDVYTDLQRAGEIDDILMGRNMGKAKWAHEYEYWYMSKFNAPEEMRGKQIELVFEGVDYSCEVWLNGIYLGKHEGMYEDFHFDITRLTRFEQWYEGCNIIMIKLDPPPRNYRRVAGKKFCFSGDYMPGLVPFGIWRPVKVRATGITRIRNFRIESDLLSQQGANVRVEIEIENLGCQPIEVDLVTQIRGENFESRAYPWEGVVTLRPGRNKVCIEVLMEDVKLWWPWDMGEQHLYELSAVLVHEGNRLDSKREVFGVREVKLEMNPGFLRAEVENPWTFVINGRPYFLRGACWGGPPSYFYGRNSDRKYEDRLKMVKEANINNLRIFGWHPPEVPKFYELCDRLGITVWTNFGFATQAFEATPEFLYGVLNECKATVIQRRNHPSNIIWMGGEEVFFSDAHVDSDNKLIMEEIGKAVAEVTNVPYALASPMSGEYGQKLGFAPKESSHANEHYYAAGHLLMEDYYGTMDYCVIPELTAASAPAVESLKKFIPEKELWPMGPSWGYHWADLTILKLLNVEVFGETRDGSLEEFVESTQLAHGIIAQYALEHFRRRKPRVSAVALCHFMTYLPDIKWGIIDYYGKKKTAFEYVTRAYQPLLPSLEYRKRRFNSGSPLEASVWIVNDYHRSFENLILSWKVLSPAGKTLGEGSRVVHIDAESSKAYLDLDTIIEGSDYELFKVEMSIADAKGKILSSNFHTLMVGDQEAAIERSLKLYDQMRDDQQAFGKSYYRYHEELWDID